MSLRLHTIVTIATVTRDTDVVDRVVPQSYRDCEPSLQEFFLCLREIALLKDGINTVDPLVEGCRSSNGGWAILFTVFILLPVSVWV